MGDVRVRHMVAEDAEPISDAFRAIGWDKPRTLYLRYVSEADAGERVCLLAECEGGFAGYGTLQWVSAYPPFRYDGVPEITDLNVLPRFRRRGVGAALLDELEAAAGKRSRAVGLGVGLHAGYGSAQRLYVRRGYLPDGRGIIYDDKPIEAGTSVPIDDDANLMFTKSLP